MTHRRRTGLGLLAALALVATLAGVAPAGAAEHSKVDTTVVSHDGTPIGVTVFRPAGASAESPAPMILHSHGWGGSRSTALSAFTTELDAGFGVLSFDQRGFGQTPGPANVQDPELEGRDVIALIDYIAGLDWVARDLKPGVPSNASDAAKARANVGIREDAEPDPTDPVLFAMGLSYGGGFQMIGALTEIRETGRTRFNALSPEITWFDLAESLAPAKVARSAWIALLYAGGLRAHRQDIHVAQTYGTVTGQWPDETAPPGVPNLQQRFRNNSPVTFVEAGLRLDVPVLIGQGSSDNLFNLNQGWKNFERTLTDGARAKSVFVGYNGGHALPNVLPPGYPGDVQVGGNSDPCSAAVGGFRALRLNFFAKVIAGESPRGLLGGGEAYHVATPTGDCVHTNSLDAETVLTPAAAPGLPNATVTTTGAGAPQHLELAAGPLRFAGIPVLDADVTTVGADQRVFVGLAVGPNPAQARVVHNNLMPLRELLPVVRAHRTVELAGVAANVAAGEKLYLTITPVSDMYFGHGSTRTPGVVTLENLKVTIPVR